MRGYFPVKGMYSNLGKPTTQQENVQFGGSVKSGSETTNIGSVTGKIPPTISKLMDRAHFKDGRRQSAELIYARFREGGMTPAMALAAMDQASFESNLNPNAINPGTDPKKTPNGVAYGLFQLNRFADAIGTPTPNFMDNKTAGSAKMAKDNPDTYYNAQDPETNIARVLLAMKKGTVHNRGVSQNATADDCFRAMYFSGAGAGGNGKNVEGRAKHGTELFGSAWSDSKLNHKVLAEEKNMPPVATPSTLNTKDPGTTDPAYAASTNSQGTSALQDMGLDGYDIDNILAYPYYHVFHGVVTQVTHSYSGGVQTASVQCMSMLHFWEYHRMSTNAAIFGTVKNTGNKPSLVGNNFTGKHPYEIIYNLHNDTAGAAGGVAWAISQKTNQDARSSLTGETLYSLNIKYWQKRFNTRDIKLRMHGATGELFNTAQATFLAKQSSDSLLALLSGRFNGSVAKGKSILSQAMAVGLWNKRKLEALLWTQNVAGKINKNSNTPQFDLSMPEMIAFVSDIGQWGGVQLFESTYESKHDVAVKVCQVTGFEFYQDVDGDFVFKPPMYNLDTSSSRVYRLEEIDIISFNFEDKEPQATYITCKGSSLAANLKGTGTDNEMGSMGQYIDFRLVAQYGWRPADLETSYFTDPKSMFLAGVNRLDILNAPTKSASATIPLRPELRPGYPVYIPYIDAYYYCNSFAHSFSVGGSCTTSLQLIAKRSKFFAPGQPKTKGISGIQLGEPGLPEKPLQVLDNAGNPRLSGFPNVVMALDPTKLDPMFFIVGVDVAHIDDDDVQEGIMEQAMQLGIVKPVLAPDQDPEKPGPYYRMVTGDHAETMFYLKTSNSPPIVGSPAKVSKSGNTIVDFKEAANAFVKLQKKALTAEAKVGKAGLKAQQAAAAAQKAANAKKNGATDAKAVKLNDKAKELAAQLKATQEADTASLMGKGKGQSPHEANLIASLQALLGEIRKQFLKPEHFQSRYSGDPNSAITVLDMLSDKKAIFSNGSLPGAYRYYSSAHPDPDQQGQRLLTINTRKDKADTNGKRQVTTTSFLEPLWSRKDVPQYTLDQFIKAPPGAPKPEAQLVSKKPKLGIKVLTSNPNFREGEILPTSEIREMMFATHLVLGEKQSSVNKRVVRYNMNGSVRNAFELAAQNDDGVGTPSPASSIQDALAGWNDSIDVFIQSAVQVARRAVPNWKTEIPNFPAANPPVMVTIKGSQILTSVPMNSFQFSDTAEAYPKPLAFPESDIIKLTSMWKELAGQYGSGKFDSIRAAEITWRSSLKANDIPDADANAIDSAFVAALMGTMGIDTTPSETETSATIGKAQHPIVSPVFPVSDSRGYQVVGSYRYGRDVDIDPDGVFDVLHSQDVLSMLDKDLVEQFLLEKLGNGLTAETEKKLFAAIRKNWSNQDMIDHGVAKMNGNLLESNLNNWMADKGKDGIQKLPINNAAFSLADLAPHTSRDFCSCKAAEADVLLDIAGEQNFVQFTQAGIPAVKGSAESGQDKTIQWIKDVTARVAIPWTQSQAALRGSVPEPPTSFISSVNSAVGSLMDHDRGTDQATKDKQAAFDAATKQTAALKFQLLNPGKPLPKELL